MKNTQSYYSEGDSNKDTLSFKIILFLLTLTYLTIEYSFNARLMDVIGSSVSKSDISDIEVYGRTLSGVAVALFVFQFLQGKKKSLFDGLLSTLIICVVVVVAVYFFIKVLVEDIIIPSTSLSFRRASTYVSLIQREFAKGRLELIGLNDSVALGTADRKIFLGTFPFIMSYSIKNLAEKTPQLNSSLIRRSIEDQIPIGNLYTDYKKGVLEVKKKWLAYNKVPGQEDFEILLLEKQQKAWSDYVKQIEKYYGSVENVPWGGIELVIIVGRVQKSGIPVPDDWDGKDQQVFYDAVEQRVSQTHQKNLASLQKKGLQPGADFPEFFYSQASQKEFLKKLNMPEGSFRVEPSYPNVQSFREGFYNKVLAAQVAKIERALRAKESSFDVGGINHDLGLQSAEAVVVPMLALLFSLIGALTHTAKLAYLTAKILYIRARYAIIVPFSILIAAWLSFSFMETKVTQSPVVVYMYQKSNELHGGTWSNKLVLNAIHVLMVGQSFSYPFNNYLRENALRGFAFKARLF